LKGEVKVVSNGNVGTWEHIVKNLEETGADGVMVGETLLGNPWFASSESFELRPDPLSFS